MRKVIALNSIQLFFLSNELGRGSDFLSHIKRSGVNFQNRILFFFSQFVHCSIEKDPPEVFYVKRFFLKMSLNSLESNCARVSFLIKSNLLKRDSGTDVFM